MMYELEFILMEEQRALHHASRQPIYENNLPIKDQCNSPLKINLYRKVGIKQSIPKCCAKCC